MKKILLLLMAVVLCLQLMTVAYAAADKTSGIYAVSGAASLSAFKTADGAAAEEGTFSGDASTLYGKACRFDVTYSGTTTGARYMLYVLTEQATPNSSNVVYINQQTATGNAVTFSNVYPMQLTEGTYYIYISGTGVSLQSPVASFKYFEAKFTLKVRLPVKDVVSANVSRNGEDLGSGVQWNSVREGVFVLEAPGLVPRTEQISAANGETVSFVLTTAGDVNGSGRVDVDDMQCLYTFLSENRREGYLDSEEYFDAIADHNGDGAVNILDYQSIYDSLLDRR